MTSQPEGVDVGAVVQKLKSQVGDLALQLAITEVQLEIVTAEAEKYRNAHRDMAQLERRLAELERGEQDAGEQGAEQPTSS